MTALSSLQETMVPSSQKTVLITGCSKGGIGDALAQSFHSQGLKVFATARNLSKIKHLEEMGMTIFPLDVVENASINGVVESVRRITGGTLDVLVNNSGMGDSAPILEADLEYARKLMEVNFFGRVATTNAFAPLIMKSKGTILNIGSIAAVYPGPWKGMYCATQGAVHQWSDTLRMELEPFDVKVVLVVTGAVFSNFFNNLPTMRLRSDSIYNPARESIEAVMNGTATKKNHISAKTYAEQVVKNVLKTSPKRRHWAGGVANLIWLASAIAVFWGTAWDFLLAQDFAITALRKNLKVAGKDRMK